METFRYTSSRRVRVNPGNEEGALVTLDICESPGNDFGQKLIDKGNLSRG